MFLKSLWFDLSGEVAEIHMRTDANNLVTTAASTRLAEQKDTIHMINQLRVDCMSGNIDDMAHVVSHDMMADVLTKEGVDAKYLKIAIKTGYVPNVGKHPPFRELMENTHKAWLIGWICQTLPHASEVVSFMNTLVVHDIASYLASTWSCWY